MPGRRVEVLTRLRILGDADRCARGLPLVSDLLEQKKEKNPSDVGPKEWLTTRGRLSLRHDAESDNVDED